MNRAKVLGGALASVLVVVALYFANRYWIAPLTKQKVQAKALGSSSPGDSSDRPLAPDFTLTDVSSGQKISLADYKGKVVLLDFWATWCGPCRIEIPGFVEIQNKYRDQGFSVIGISLDEGSDAVDQVRDFYKEFNMNYPVGIGDDKLSELYGGVIGLPTSLVVGRDGRIYAKHTGATPVSVFEDEIKMLLAAQGTDEVQNFHQSGRVHPQDEIRVETPAEVSSVVPGVDVSKLTPAELTKFQDQLRSQKCTCNCNYTLLQCRKVDRNCAVSLKLARAEFDKFMKAKNGSQRAAGGT